MSTDRWERTKEILEEALHLAPDQRPSYLDRVCGLDAELREEVESLIASHEDADSHFLDPTTLRVDEFLCPETPVGARTNQTIGHYLLAGELGRGGMGVVYAAEDLKLRRKVAIKFLPSELANVPRALERFEQEARAASALDHRNICSIYELGEHEGQPFTVMQLLEGQTLREWIEARANDTISQRQLELLDIATQIADGLDAAHQKGIIHRDIKPANIFVTSRGEAKILDFGVAKFLEVAETTTEPGGVVPSAAPHGNLTATRTGAAIGTPSYLSPEQIRGERLDARTDLFSFGLVLYEMATGQKAFVGNLSTLMCEPAESPPVVPIRQLNPELSPKLEATIAKALEKDRERRFQSAQALRTALEGLRVELEHKEKRTRAGRPWLVYSAAAVLVLGGAFYWTNASHRWRNTPSTKPIAEVKSRPSVAVLGFKNLAGKPDDDWLSMAVAEMLTTELSAGEQLRTISEDTVASVKHQLSLPNVDSYSQETLGRVRTALGIEKVVVGSYMVVQGKQRDSLRLDMRVQDTTSGDASAVLTETGTTDDLLEVVARAGARLRETFGIARITPTEQLSVQAALPSSPEAARLYAEGIAKLRVFDDVTAHDLLQRAVDADPSSALAHSALAASWTALGYEARAASEAKKAFNVSSSLSREDRLVTEARYHEATHEWDKAIAGYQSLSTLFPDDIEYGLRLATVQNRAGKAKDAMETIQTLHALPAPERDDPRVDLTEAWAAQLLSDLPHALSAAESAGRKAQARGTNLILARARGIQGVILSRQGDSPHALATLADARAIYEKAGDRAGVAHNLNDTAVVQYKLGNLAEAFRLYDESRMIFDSVGNVGGAATSSQNMAIVLYDQGNLPEAKRNYEQALADHRKAGNTEGVAKTLNSLANVLADQGNQKAAERMYEQSMATSHAINSKIDEATALTNLGLLLADRGNIPAARQRLEEALAIKRQIGNRSSTANTISSLGDVLMAQGDLAAARKDHEEALAIRTDIGQKSMAAEDRMALATLALEDGNLRQAFTGGESAVREFQAEGRADQEAYAHLLLAKVLLAQQESAEAQAEVEAAQRLTAKSESAITRLGVAIVSARVEAATGGRATAMQKLESVQKKAARTGLIGIGLEARLAWGELALASNHLPSARAALLALEKDAQARGFGLIARKASGLTPNR